MHRALRRTSPSCRSWCRRARERLANIAKL
jgi:hypothetical protein